MIEIRYAADTEVPPSGPVEQLPAPCRRLRRRDDGTLEVVEVLTERPRVDDSYTMVDTLMPNPAKPPRESTPQSDKPIRISRAKQPRRGYGRGKAWGRTTGLTAEKVMAGILEGKSLKEIAAQFHRNYQTVNGVLIAGRKTSEDFRAAEVAMKQCACGRTKFTHQPICSVCRSKANAREQRKANKCL